jgi:hypothetical protein
MKKIGHILGGAALLALPVLASAQLADGGGGGPFEDLLLNILEFTNDILIPFIIAIGFLVFVWGMFQYFIAGGANDEKKEKGKSLMIYATLGFVLIIVFWGVVNLLTQSTGLQDKQIKDTPTVTVPGGAT